MNSADGGTAKPDHEVAAKKDHHRGVRWALRETFSVPAGDTPPSIESLIEELNRLG
jgi:hypothetical protein